MAAGLEVSLTLGALKDRDMETRPPALLEAVFEAMGEFVLVREADGRLAHVNAAFLDAFGGARADWVGRWFALAPGGGADGARRRYDARMRAPRGLLWVEWIEYPMADGRSVAVGRDVTEQRRHEAAQSEAARGKSVFFAAVTHELRTPLAGALGAARLLEDTGLKPDQAAYTAALKRSAGHALSLIDDILDLSRLEAGKFELRAEPVDIRALVEEVCELLAPKAFEKGIDLAHACDAETPALIRADPVRLRQILFNLIGNGVKFTEIGGVLVTVESEGETLQLGVRDTGPGIPEADQPRLFTHFERGAAERAGAVGGAGLGLAMVKSLVDAMDGEVGLESVPGAGALFWVRLTPPYLAPASDERPLAGETLYIAAPNPVRREALAHQGQALGARVRLAASRKALDPPANAVVLLDEAWADQAGALSAKRILIIAKPETKDRFGPDRRPPGVDGWLAAPVRAASLAAYAGTSEPEAGPAPPPFAAPTAAAAAAAIKPLEGYRLLLAEDDPVNGLIAETVLKKLGATPVRVETGRAALAALEADAIDAVLLDLRMPEMDGFETAAAIRALPDERASIPVIALTANASEADREACLSAGMDAFLAKPLEPAALAPLIKRLSRAPRRGRDLRNAP